MGVTALTIARIHILLAFRGDVVSVKEWFFIENAGQAAIEANAPLPLFDGARAAKMSDTLTTVARIGSVGGVAVVMFAGPVPPGQTKIEVDYEVPRKTGMKFVKRMPYAAKAVVLMSEQTEVDIVGPGIQPSSVRRIGEGVTLLVARGGPVAAGGSIEFEFKGTPRTEAATVGPVAPPLPMGSGIGDAARPGSGAGMSGGSGGGAGAEPKPGPIRDWRQIRWAIVLALFGVFYVAIYLGGRRRAEAERFTNEKIEAERRSLLERLAELARRGDGSAGADAARERLVARLAEIYSQRGV